MLREDVLQDGDTSIDRNNLIAFQLLGVHWMKD